jgi:hypothetical protein
MKQEDIELAIDRLVGVLVAQQGATIDQIIAALHLKACELDRGNMGPSIQ